MPQNVSDELWESQKLTDIVRHSMDWGAVLVLRFQYSDGMDIQQSNSCLYSLLQPA